MFRRPMVMRRGVGVLGVAAVGGLGVAAGRAGANRAAQEQEQEARLSQLEAQQAAATAPAPAPPMVAPAPAPPVPGGTPTSANSEIAQLQQLSQLKASGVLTDQEFEQMKARILSGGQPA